MGGGKNPFIYAFKAFGIEFTLGSYMGDVQFFLRIKIRLFAEIKKAIIIKEREFRTGNHQPRRSSATIPRGRVEVKSGRIAKAIGASKTD
jgi:hypothetical protein